MDIAKDRVVAIDYRLTDEQGNLLDTSNGREPLRYLHGAGNLIGGLERALDGASPGNRLEVRVSPDEGYGQRDDSLVQRVGKEVFEGVEEPQVGMRFRARTKDGERIFAVTDIEGNTVTVDGNHPLAGMTLNFEVEVKEVRPATEDEISHGHLH